MINKLSLTLLSLLCSIAISAQNFQTIEEVQETCAQLGFMSNQEAEIAVDRILNEFGLTRTFVIQECPDINNAVAKIIQISPNYQERYILYDGDFFDRIDDSANTNWASLSILAHEIGHHLNGHSLDKSGSNHKYELEADYFSGTAMGLLGASLDEAQGAIKTLKYEKATATHPAKADRLAEIERGWNIAKKRKKSRPKNEIARTVINVDNGNNIEVLNTDREKEELHYDAAVVAYQKKRYSEAAKQYLLAYQHSPEDLQYLHFAATNFVLDGKLDLALKYFMIIVKKGYKDLNEQFVNGVNQQIGLIYYSKNQNEDAVKFFELLLKGNSSDVNVYVNLADLYIKNGNFDKASEYAQIASGKKVQKAYTSYNLARVFFLLKNYKKAQEYYRMTINMDSSYHNAYLDLSSVYLGESNDIITEMNSLGSSSSDDKKYASLNKQKDVLQKMSITVLEEGVKALPNAQGLRNRLRRVKTGFQGQ